MRYLLLPFVLFETFLLSFCNPNDCSISKGAGGPQSGRTDAEREADGDGRIPTLKECLRG